MKISVDGKDLFSLNDTQMKVIMNDIHEDECHEDMCRRLKWVLTHKYEQCFKRLKQEWDAKLLENGVTMVPTQPDEYAELVFSQPNYQSRKQREESVK